MVLCLQVNIIQLLCQIMTKKGIIRCVWLRGGCFGAGFGLYLGVRLFMLKKFVLGGMVVMAALLGNACGDDGSSDSPAGPADSEVTLSSSSDDVALGSSSSSSVTESPSTSSGQVPQSAESDGSSSSEKAVDGSSSSDGKASSSSGKVESSSSSVKSSSSSEKSSSSVASSSSEYVPFDHSKAFDGTLWRAGAYKTFIDTRNGREYYYLEMEANGKSLKVMAENLNVGDMVRGYKDQQDDSKIERYCYDNDTTNCDRYGGLYQWAETMQLPSECNTKSCADLIQENHQGICPNGWRLMTAADFEFIVKSNGNTHGVEGTRSTFGFGGYNTTGFSLVGAGYNWNHSFKRLNEVAFWHYPQEGTLGEETSLVGLQGTTSTTIGEQSTLKTHGFSVRCVKDD